MNLADLSIKRPTFITCLVIVVIAVGLLAMRGLGVDLFPDVTFPVVTVSTGYPGAGPSEVETLVSKPLEDEISTLAGIKRLSSINREGLSTVVAEFTLETDVKFAEQQIRDRVGSSKRNLPKEIKEPVIRRIDPSDQPILILSLTADPAAQLGEAQLFDIADDYVKPKFEQINKVGLVEVLGGRKREIHVELDRAKLKSAEISASQVANRLSVSGQNIPLGKVDENKKETVFRTMGEFRSLEEISKTVVNFFGNETPVTVSDLAQVTDSLVDESSRTYVNGKKSLLFYVFRQSGANTIAVVDAVKNRIGTLNAEMERLPGKPKLEVIRDGAWWIRANVTDVEESIFLGIILAVLVVFFFLTNVRSTIITGLALPNSLIGAFILMSIAGFSINIMSLLALSLSVGLLIDDAIVVRENIFRHMEMGSPPIKAAREGTAEVQLAVIATTFTVLAVFGPIGFLKGVTGQFFKQFGLTICFAMLISLYDALTIAPMLSAYFAGITHKKAPTTAWGRWMERFYERTERFHKSVENQYSRILAFTIRRPFTVMGISTLVFLGSCASVIKVPKTFLPPQDAGEFSVSMDLPPGTSLEGMEEVAKQVDEIVRKNPEVQITSLTIGGRDGEANVAEAYVHLVPSKERKLNTSEVKQKIRDQLKGFAFANPVVKDYDAVGGGQRPFNLNIIGNDFTQLEKFANQVFEYSKKHPGLKDVEINFRPGKPEFQVKLDGGRAERLGVSSILLGQELRTQIEGDTPVKFRENGREYDIRVRLKESQRNLRTDFNETYIPNLNGTLVRLASVAKPFETTGPAKITRQDRSRYIQIAADITPGAGMGEVMTDLSNFMDKELKIPAEMRYAFVGQAENFKELGENMAIAVGLSILFIFIVLASLYESFVTPLTIMLALPLAICGSFVALFITRESLNIFSMIGCIMLLGVATKNSILLVDYATKKVQEGMDRTQALMEAGRTRLRPILMTTMALIAGTIPIALGLNEASRQRTSMGVAIVGGLISSTVLTLLVVPAAYSFIDRFRVWSNAKMKAIFSPE